MLILQDKPGQQRDQKRLKGILEKVEIIEKLIKPTKAEKNGPDGLRQCIFKQRKWKRANTLSALIFVL